MTPRLVPGAVLALVVCGLAATPATAAGDGYSAYVACSHRASARPAHECRLSQNPAAFFKSARRDATYKVCVKFPNRKQRLCASAQDAPEGEKQRVSITTGDTGLHKATWYVAGKKVATWNFTVVAG